MNTLLWVLQVLAAVLYWASGTMKVFRFDKISADVRSSARCRAARGRRSAFLRSSAPPA